MQGLPVGDTVEFFLSGIIPARAGTTTYTGNVRRFFEDHPCACRDYAAELTAAVDTEGSSLRVQGLPFSVNTEEDKSRIIPARAGTTSLQCASHLAQRDHPCACRDYPMR